MATDGPVTDLEAIRVLAEARRLYPNEKAWTLRKGEDGAYEINPPPGQQICQKSAGSALAIAPARTITAAQVEAANAQMLRPSLKEKLIMRIGISVSLALLVGTLFEPALAFLAGSGAVTTLVCESRLVKKRTKNAQAILTQAQKENQEIVAARNLRATDTKMAAIKSLRQMAEGDALRKGESYPAGDLTWDGARLVFHVDEILDIKPQDSETSQRQVAASIRFAAEDGKSAGPDVPDLNSITLEIPTPRQTTTLPRLTPLPPIPLKAPPAPRGVSGPACKGP